jgi:hypothetical protein
VKPGEVLEADRATLNEIVKTGIWPGASAVPRVATSDGFHYASAPPGGMSYNAASLSRTASTGVNLAAGM